MSKRYILLAVIAISTTLLLALLPAKKYRNNVARDKMHLKTSQSKGESVEDILLTSLNNERYLTVDELSAKIIEEDPSYLIVDIRDSLQFNNYSLPGSINIPFEKMLDIDNLSYFINPAYTKVLISNGTLMSDQAWMIMRREGFKNVKVMKGGLNEFFNVLIDPVKPKETDPSEFFDQYSFRKAAGVYFGMPNPKDFIPEGDNLILNVKTKNPSTASPVSKPAASPKIVVPVKHDVVEDEGC